jgi:hypothetical protein
MNETQRQAIRDEIARSENAIAKWQMTRVVNSDGSDSDRPARMIASYQQKIRELKEGL